MTRRQRQRRHARRRHHHVESLVLLRDEHEQAAEDDVAEGRIASVPPRRFTRQQRAQFRREHDHAGRSRKDDVERAWRRAFRGIHSIGYRTDREWAVCVVCGGNDRRCSNCHGRGGYWRETRRPGTSGIQKVAAQARPSNEAPSGAQKRRRRGHLGATVCPCGLALRGTQGELRCPAHGAAWWTLDAPAS